jgi:cobalt-zinc-cadmium efflux system protein
MLKIKNEYKLPVVLGISIFLMLAETAGSFFSKSLSLLSYAGLILSAALSALPFIANQNIGIQYPESFRRSQFQSISINCIMLLAIAAYIIYRSAILFSVPSGINLSLTCWMAFSGFVGLAACLIILFPELKTNKQLKVLFFKYVFCAGLAFVIIAASVIYYIKDMYFLDPAISVSIAVLIIAQVILLMKQALSALIIKRPF